MKLTLVPTPQPLSDWVACLWKLEASTAEASPLSSHRVLPDGFPELIVHLKAPYQRWQRGQLHQDPRAFVFGQLSEPIELRSPEPVLAVGARLRPAALAHVTTFAGHEINQQPVSLEGLWGTGGRQFERRLLESANADEALARLTKALCALRATRPPSLGQQLAAHATSWIQHNQGRGSIHGLSRYLGYSRRHIERLFNDNLGISPKLFARLQRFQALQRAIASSPQPHWSALAIDSGYSDQAHMIREFRQFSGQPPRAFARSNHSLAEAFVMRPDNPTKYSMAAATNVRTSAG